MMADSSCARVLLMSICVMLLACCSLGCGATARLAVGPTLDTRGNFGVDAKVVLGAGPGIGTHVMTTATLGGGMGDGGVPMFVAGAGLEARTSEDESALRGNLLYSARRFYRDPESLQLHGVGLAIGGIYALHHGRTSRAFGLVSSLSQIGIGADLQGELLGGDGARLLFSLPFVVEGFEGTR